MKLYLLRHTETVANVGSVADSITDTKLSERGEEQAQDLIPKLAELEIDMFVVSPLQRTKNTLKPYLDTLKKKPKVIVEKLTLERDLGEFTGSELNAFQLFCEKNIYNRVHHRPPGGESLIDVERRAKQFLAGLKKQHADKSILVCGHQNFLRCLQIELNGWIIDKFYDYPKFNNGEIKEFGVYVF